MKKIVVILIIICSILWACKQKTPQEKEQNNISNIENKIFSKGEEFNEELARETLAKYEEYAKLYEYDSLTPEYFFRASSLCVGLGNYLKALAYLQKIEQKYPKYPKIAEVFFQHAFILDTYLNDKIGAKNFYDKFIQNYPTHHLIPEAKNALLLLDLNDQELIKMLEDKNK
jgi:tetratricopeptide (TPR) repeat protein